MGQNVVLEVSEKTRPGTDAWRREWWWAEGSIWTERMVSALVNGVQGGKWYGLMVNEGFIGRRPHATLLKQEKRPGIGRCQADHQRWTNAFFAAHGLFTLAAAHAQARHPR